MGQPRADLVVRADKVHTMDAGYPSAVGVAVRRGQIIALARRDEELARLIGRHTLVLAEPALVVLPAFIDTHNHLLAAALDTLRVSVAPARTIDELVELIRQRAAAVPAGQWIITATGWHEQRLTERRLPTAVELDRASVVHPILVRRGGHNGVLNSTGLLRASIDVTGQPTGLVQDAALHRLRQVIPPPETGMLVAGLAQASAHYAAHGIGAVRDPGIITPQGWHAYRQAAKESLLSVRSHPMILSGSAAIAEAGSMDAYLDRLESQGIRPGAGDAVLRLWGLKFVLDGGVETAALHEPYQGRPDYHGTLLWKGAALADALTIAARRGWPVGTHAFGDRAIATLLDAVRAVRQRSAPGPGGTLVMEHGGLIGTRITDAVELGVHITVQQPLLDGLAEDLIAAWGTDRAANLFPLRQLLDAGASISAGTDHPTGPLDPLRAVHGMLTRQTPAGVLGPQHAIGRTEAIRLYTTAATRRTHRHSGPRRTGRPRRLPRRPPHLPSRAAADPRPRRHGGQRPCSTLQLRLSRASFARGGIRSV